MDRRHREYIAYNERDEFLELGTAQELSELFGITTKQVRQRARDLKRRGGEKKSVGIKFYLVDKE